MQTKLNRRVFLRTAGVGIAGAGIGAALPLTGCAQAAPEQAPVPEQLLRLEDGLAVADTLYGKVKGYVFKDIYTFKGIPYGADTSGANRFMPPVKPEPWTDIRTAYYYGPSAPQTTSGSNDWNWFRDHWNYDVINEDCLRINVWTPGLSDQKKRPVIVWIHGGGFTSGNGQEHDSYDGTNLAIKGDVVVCTLNHRLGPFGYMDLSAIGGAPFAASGVAGLLDLVAALEWIRDNIANFGGDPGNVTIFGQSGGGAKVNCLLAMPSAKGLFHKAFCMSGSSLRMVEKDVATKLGSTVMQEAGLTAGNIKELQAMPWEDLLKVASVANRKMEEDWKIASAAGGRTGFAPSIDEVYLPQHPFDPAASALSADIPMLIGSTMNETSPSINRPDLEEITLDGVKEKLRESLQDKTDTVVEAYAKCFPGRKPVEIWSLIASSNRRINAVKQADLKSVQTAPVYLYWFTWQSPLDSGRVRAPHCNDISFWFNNTDRMVTHTGGGARPARLADKMSETLLQFARTGNPNHSGIPEWPAYNSENGLNMIFDDQCEVKSDPDKEARITIA
jgi:para-nitrobenzyl esterase